MNKNQIIVTSVCIVIGVGIYLFADTKKSANDPAAMSGQPAIQQPDKQAIEALDIEQYVAEVNAKITDNNLREKLKNLSDSKSYKELIDEYQKLDKPLAIAYYSVKLAERENSAESFVRAGDFNSMLMQTAPDEKAKAFLSDNAISSYKKAVDFDTSNSAYRIRLANAYIENGSAPMQGVSILLELVRQDSTNVDALLMLGRFGIVSGQYDKAIARLEKILYLRPQNSEALLLMAEAYNAQGNKSKAVEMLERCKRTVNDPEAKREIENYIKSIKKSNN